MVEIFKDGKRVSHSKNLRGILDYARKHGVAKVLIMENLASEFGGTLNIIFGDGATVTTNFNSYKVLESWIAARRSWNLKETLSKSTTHFNLRCFDGPCA